MVPSCQHIILPNPKFVDAFAQSLAKPNNDLYPEYTVEVAACTIGLEKTTEHRLEEEWTVRFGKKAAYPEFCMQGFMGSNPLGATLHSD